MVASSEQTHWGPLYARVYLAVRPSRRRPVAVPSRGLVLHLLGAMVKGQDWRGPTPRVMLSLPRVTRDLADHPVGFAFAKGFPSGTLRKPPAQWTCPESNWGPTNLSVSR